MSKSILTTTKEMLGIQPEATYFDSQLVVCINSAFSVLNQLGVGPKDGFFRVVLKSHLHFDSDVRHVFGLLFQNVQTPTRRSPIRNNHCNICSCFLLPVAMNIHPKFVFCDFLF